MSSRREGGRDAGEVLADLWRLFQSVLDDAEPALAGLGMSPKAFFLLEAARDHPFPAELAKATHLPPPTVTYLVKQLERSGFLDRRAEPGDLRKFRLVLTGPGLDALGLGMEAMNRAFRGRLDRLDRDEAAAFDRIVARLAGKGSPGCDRS